MPRMRRVPEEEANEWEEEDEEEWEEGEEEGFEPPALTESDVLDWVGQTSFQRGLSYIDGSVISRRRTGGTLKAGCQGTATQPYRVEVTIESDAIEEAYCSCPVGGGGRCKHVAAVLMTYIGDPDSFMEVEALDTALERRSKPELIALIRQMIARHPDLDMLLELPAPDGGGARPPVNETLIRRQVRNAFSTGGYDWYDSGVNSAELNGLVRMADNYVHAGDWRSGAVIYQIVAQEILEHYEEVADEEGDLGEVVNECAEGLGRCLSDATDPVQRETLLHAMFDIYRWDVDFGGIGIGDSVPDIILEQATLEERERMAVWVRAAMPAGSSWSDNYHRQVYGGFLLALEGDNLDDETFLRIAKETGRTSDLVNRLLELNRIDEALDHLRSTESSNVLTLADLFVAGGHGDLAEQLVRLRVQAGVDANFTIQFNSWLKRQAHARGDLATALDLALGLFRQRPSLSDYNEVQELATPLGRWEHLRAEILQQLEARQQHDLLTEIHLREGNIEDALRAVTQVNNWLSYGEAPLPIRVARAAEATHPHDAMGIYVANAQKLISQRGRDNYATAARYLARVRDLYRHIGEEQVWRLLINDIREQNRQLRALKEELTKAGL